MKPSSLTSDVIRQAYHPHDDATAADGDGGDDDDDCRTAASVTVQKSVHET